MLSRLLQVAVVLFGVAGVFLVMYGLVILSDDLRRYEALAGAALPVQARMIARSVRIDAGTIDAPSRENYVAVGTFEIVGRPGAVYENVDIDGGRLWPERAAANDAAPGHQPNVVVDAWFDPRSKNDAVYFPLTLTDPRAVAAEKQARHRMVVWTGAGSLLVAVVLVPLLIRFS